VTGGVAHYCHVASACKRGGVLIPLHRERREGGGGARVPVELALDKELASVSGSFSHLSSAVSISILTMTVISARSPATKQPSRTLDRDRGISGAGCTLPPAGTGASNHRDGAFVGWGTPHCVATAPSSPGAMPESPG
jgi:hypothetical protein